MWWLRVRQTRRRAVSIGNHLRLGAAHDLVLIDGSVWSVIRDMETAQNAVQAALTGHSCLLHTVMSEMTPGIHYASGGPRPEPFLISSTVVGVMAHCAANLTPAAPTAHLGRIIMLNLQPPCRKADHRQAGERSLEMPQHRLLLGEPASSEIKPRSPTDPVS